MIDFIMNYWDSILVVVAFVAIIVVLALRGKKKIIFEILYSLVTEAEKLYGSGTGDLKFSYVMEKIYGVLPSIFKVFVTYDALERWIEKALIEAKEYWAKQADIADNTNN